MDQQFPSDDPHAPAAANGGAAAPAADLTGMAAGARVRVQAIDGGHSLLDRLLALGIAPGVALQVLRNPSRGPLLVRVHDTRVALGRGQAAKIRAVPAAVRETRARDDAAPEDTDRENTAHAAE